MRKAAEEFYRGTLALAAFSWYFLQEVPASFGVKPGTADE